MPIGLGEAAAFGTALCWGVSSLVQGSVARRIGSTEMTLMRMPYQTLFLSLLCLTTQVDASLGLSALLQLIASGLLGICLCDFMLYRAMLIVGPAVAVLLLSLSAAFSALFGWLFLHESMPLQAMAGIVATLSGIAWVLTEHSASTLPPGQEIPSGKRLFMGIMLSVSASVSLSISFIFLKSAMHTGVNPLWAAFVRMFAGAIALWGIGFCRGWVRSLACGMRCNPRFYWVLFLSCFCGSAGMWFSSLAMNLVPVGVAATLIGMQPIMVTMLGAAWYRKQPSSRAICGILFAFCGTALICLR